MINDALSGNIDLIITKSISRFARNTLDTITYVRKLKEKNIEVFFEKENLWTFDPKSELILTIMASIAQEESRSISQNVTWGKRAAFKQGKVSFGYKNFLGYKRGIDGKPEIDEEQAKVVILIYKMFLIDGKTCSGIADFLNKSETPTPSGKIGRWTKNTVNSILKNEKYKGDAILQKTYIDNYLEHTSKVNDGILPKYYVENSHPAIIEKEMWDQVQLEMERRDKLGAQYSSSSIFASKLICEDCGGFYGKKIWHSTETYSKEIYQCNKKFNTKEKNKCCTPNLTEEQIKNLFIKAYNEAMVNKTELLEDTLEIINVLTDTTTIDNQIYALKNDMEIVSELVKKLIDKKSKDISSLNFDKQYSEYEKRYNEDKKQLDAFVEEKKLKELKAEKLNCFYHNLEKLDLSISKWDDSIWMLIVESGIVHRDGSITFNFTNGIQITAK